MAVRVRRTGEIVCAAFSDANDGDTYINDAVHYWLVASGALVTDDEGDTWRLAARDRAKLEST